MLLSFDDAGDGKDSFTVLSLSDRRDVALIVLAFFVEGTSIFRESLRHLVGKCS